MLQSSNITEDEMRQNPQAVLDVLDFYSENLVSSLPPSNENSRTNINKGLKKLNIGGISSRIPPRTVSAASDQKTVVRHF